MRNAWRVGVAAAGAALCIAAAPDAGLKPYRVTTSQLVMVAGGADVVGAERTVGDGDAVLTAPLGVREAAELGGSVDLAIAGLPVRLDAGAILPRAAATGGEMGALPASALVFCERGRAFPEAARGSKDNPLGIRLERYGEYCLVDFEGDGSFDRAFLSGTRWPDDRRMVAIAPLRYAQRNNQPLGNAFARVRFRPSGTVWGRSLMLDIEFGGVPIPLLAVWFGEKGHRDRYPVMRSVKRGAYPAEATYGTAVITLLGYDEAARRLKVRVDKPFATSPIELEAKSGMF
jgi:hypothetical protein